MERELGKFIYLYSLGHAHQLYNALGYLILLDMSGRPFFSIFFYEPVDYIHDGDIVEKNTSTAAATSIFLPLTRPPALWCNKTDNMR
jgi:hypothetical protein